mmetsp:Transcript_5881/g.15113  ORF Transcript_5881/g.15113 Transcript_5881/m.15113 type:complete len:214 (-) Transcript_5881:482-1123(-)
MQADSGAARTRGRRPSGCGFPLQMRDECGQGRPAPRRGRPHRRRCPPISARGGWRCTSSTRQHRKPRRRCHRSSTTAPPRWCRPSCAGTAAVFLPTRSPASATARVRPRCWRPADWPRLAVVGCCLVAAPRRPKLAVRVPERMCARAREAAERADAPHSRRDWRPADQVQGEAPVAWLRRLSSLLLPPACPTPSDGCVQHAAAGSPLAPIPQR